MDELKRSYVPKRTTAVNRSNSQFDMANLKDAPASLPLRYCQSKIPNLHPFMGAVNLKSKIRLEKLSHCVGRREVRSSLREAAPRALHKWSNFGVSRLVASGVPRLGNPPTEVLSTTRYA
ncbi:hypothetical protein H6G36_11305 [Anabaena minutissima FACHB-250]|nr:hypothetical protein [Anabaena minutissima FACHB-250]